MSPGRASFRHAPAALTRSVGDEILAALPEGAEVVSLSETSAEVWRALAGAGRSLPELVEVLAVVHGSPPEAIARDVRELLSDLAARGLVEEVEEEDGRGRPRR